MPNPGQPTIHPGDTGDAVERAQRGVRRTPGPDLVVDGVFGSKTEQAIKEFQQAEGLAVDGIVGPATWHALPDGGPMPVLQEGSSGQVVHRLQTVLKNGHSNWGTGPGAIDGDFGPNTKASVQAIHSWGHLAVHGKLGDRTWDDYLHPHTPTLETEVGLNFVID